MTTIIISGVTSAGKSTLAAQLAKLGIFRIVTVTTREMRNGEIKGRDYQFVALEEFNAIEKSGGFIETNEFSGAKYGTLVADLERPGLKVIVVDPNGHRNIKAALKKASKPYLSVFLDCNEKEQAYRFLERAQRDVNFARHSGRFIEPTLHRAATRMGMMLTNEQHWRDVARCKESPYDLRVEHFGEHTQEAAIAEIVERAKAA